MRRGIGALLILLSSYGCVSVGPSTVEHRSDGVSSDLRGELEKREGLLNFYVDARAGKLWLQMPETLGTFLYVEGLRSGLGSNPVGLDRGELGNSRIIELRRIGDRLLFVQPNLKYRAETGSAEERTAVGESFASSILWAGTVDRKRLEGEELVDLTPFLVRDVHDISDRLKKTGQGKFKLDPERSVVDFDACLSFPDNLEFEALLTFAGEEPGRLVLETSPEPSSVTLVQHHSLIRLPDDGYAPRVFDPRAGSFAIQYVEYAADLADTIDRRWIVRHRLQKKDPGSARSPVVEPIVYYVDPAIPEPIRQAVIDGVGWWTEAFEAAGFEDAFRVEMLPTGVHPLDVRYNVLQWVHRSTRGWSYGGGIVDPRTGEMLKGHVRLGSLRLRQDRLLFEGLAGTSQTGTGAPDDPVELSLARIRQLAAHEVGHTLGLNHNFAASTYGGRASVMDYPAPLIRVTPDGMLDFSDAYGVGLGEWDLHAIRYGYSEFPQGADVKTELSLIIETGLERDLIFLTDQDARPAGAAQPLANLWDNGSDPVTQLEAEIEVRSLGLAGFGEGNVLPGTPLALLEEVLVPLYLHHRFQLTAAVKVLGGVDYRYNVRGDSQPLAHPVDPEYQRRALEVILQTLDPQFLDLPDRVLEVLLPRPADYGRNREMFTGQTAPVFDPVAAAGTAVDATVRGLLQRQRAARMVDAHRRDARQPDFREVLVELQRVVFDTPAASDRLSALNRRVQSVVAVALIDLASDTQATPEVRALTEASLSEIEQLVRGRAGGSDLARAENAYLARVIDRYLGRVATAESQAPVAEEMPPGQPIGGLGAVAAWSACSW